VGDNNDVDKEESKEPYYNEILINKKEKKIRKRKLEK
jgi:hypothetical protein